MQGVVETRANRQRGGASGVLATVFVCALIAFIGYRFVGAFIDHSDTVRRVEDLAEQGIMKVRFDLRAELLNLLDEQPLRFDVESLLIEFNESGDAVRVDLAYERQVDLLVTTIYWPFELSVLRQMRKEKQQLDSVNDSLNNLGQERLERGIKQGLDEALSK